MCVCVWFLNNWTVRKTIRKRGNRRLAAKNKGQFTLFVEKERKREDVKEGKNKGKRWPGNGREKTNEGQSPTRQGSLQFTMKHTQVLKRLVLWKVDRIKGENLHYVYVWVCRCNAYCAWHNRPWIEKIREWNHSTVSSHEKQNVAKKMCKPAPKLKNGTKSIDSQLMKMLVSDWGTEAKWGWKFVNEKMQTFQETRRLHRARPYQSD